MQRTASFPASIRRRSSDLEADGKGVPILIRQYMKLGGRMLGFNVDTGFSNVLDGLILVDLRKTPLAALSRYLGREGALKFLARHGTQCAWPVLRPHEIW